MRPSRRFLAKALTLIVLAGFPAYRTAFAQFYDPAVQSFGLSSDVARSPRLLGMGDLSITVPDHYQRITLWDFAGMPVGLGEADSTSTFDLRGNTASTLTAYDQPADLLPSGPGYREDLAGRSTGMPFEIFHRDADGNAYGAIGTVGGVHGDQPYDDGTEKRTSVDNPTLMPVLTGPFPYFGKGKLHYAISLLADKEAQHVQYREQVRTLGGTFIDLDGDQITPPDLFQPVDYDVKTLGGGLSVSYPLGKSTILGLSGGQKTDRIEGTDSRERSTSQVSESRPTNTGQATLIGHIGKSLEYGLDGRVWGASSQQDWRFSISAGSGVPPLSGRGKLLTRDESGNSMNDRVRWTSGRFELDGQVWSRWSQVKVSAPDGSDLTSFNRFLTTAYYRVGADTLFLPDSVVTNQQDDHALGYGVGASWKLRKGIAGLEYHWSRDSYGETYGGTGPRQQAWDVRGGLEYACSDVITGRVGAGLGWIDQDTHTASNEWTTQSVSLGLGLKPHGAHWSVDAGYSLTFLQSDYDDPLNHRGSRQHLETLLHWAL